MGKSIAFYTKVKRYFFPPKKTVFEETVQIWNTIEGDRTLRLRYDLNPESVVWDVGGYKGQWASDLFSKYQPYIHIFEPVPLFAEDIQERFSCNSKIKIHAYGLSNKNEKLPITLTEDRSSLYTHDLHTQLISLQKASTVFKELGASHIALMKINIEGGEYNLLEDLIDTGIIKDIDNIQVQFHSFVPHAQNRMEVIQKKLTHTHTQTYAYPFVWENWKRNHDTFR